MSNFTEEEIIAFLNATAAGNAPQRQTQQRSQQQSQGRPLPQRQGARRPPPPPVDYYDIDPYSDTYDQYAEPLERKLDPFQLNDKAFEQQMVRAMSSAPVGGYVDEREKEVLEREIMRSIENKYMLTVEAKAESARDALDMGTGSYGKKVHFRRGY